MKRLALLVAVVMMMVVNTGCTLGPHHQKVLFSNSDNVAIGYENHDYGLLRPFTGIADVLGAEANLRQATASAELTRVLAKSIERNGVATVTNSKLPASFDKAIHIGQFMNRRKQVILIHNPDFSVPPLRLKPGQEGLLPVKNIPEAVDIQVEGDNTFHRTRVYRKLKNRNGILSEFNAIINEGSL
jgi:hypothetical protein